MLKVFKLTHQKEMLLYYLRNYQISNGHSNSDPFLKWISKLLGLSLDLKPSVMEKKMIDYSSLNFTTKIYHGDKKHLDMV